MPGWSSVSNTDARWDDPDRSTVEAARSWDEVERSGSRAALVRNPENWSLFYHTLTNMQPRQLAGTLERTARHLAIPALPVDFDARYERRTPGVLEPSQEPLRANTARLRRCLPAETKHRYRQHLSEAVSGELTFLNTSLTIADADGPAWLHPSLENQPALWALKLHGFEFLNWPVLGAETPAECADGHAVFRRWIGNWARSSNTDIGTEQYLRRAWTPHSVSLRILNLSRYYCWCAPTEDDSEFLSVLRRLIFKNALFLERHVEHDVGGNHLIENGVALVTAGILFDQSDQQWLEAGLTLLEDESEQFLPDGGHFERSPMYHVITLTRYLTVLDLLRESGRTGPPELEAAAERATGFLQSIRPPDGRIPLLNDSVYGQALELDAALAYAQAVGIESVQRPTERAMASSGYFWLGYGQDRLLVDGGPSGPPHLPGHSHNDLFSVLLWVDGTQLLTDTGTHSYAPTPQRQYARSVRGHNTVQVGENEPVPVGGQYLAGRRVHPSVRYVPTDDLTTFDGEYRRENLVGRGYTHRRRIFSTDDWWVIRDDVTQTGNDVLRQRFHFHPDVTLVAHPDESTGFALCVDGEQLAYVLPVGTPTVSETTSPYFPEFGVEIDRPALTIEASPGDESMTVLFSKQPYSLEESARFVELLSP